MTQLKASCGCGWQSDKTGQSKLNTVQQAQVHSDTTGHATEVHGTVRPTPDRRYAQHTLAAQHAAIPHGAGAGAHSGTGGAAVYTQHYADARQAGPAHQHVYAPLDDKCVHCDAPMPPRPNVRRAYHGGGNLPTGK